MEVILLEKIKHLGDLGDTVKVRPGYGRNFLLPKGKALPATNANREVYEARKAELMKNAQASVNAAQLRAEKIAGLALTIAMRAGDEGKLYGSVGPNEISDAAKAAGVEIERVEIDMGEGPIRNIGEYGVAVHLHSEVETSVKVIVVEAKA